MGSRKLNKAQLAELKDLYTKDSPGSVREMVKLFNVSSTCIRWAVDYKGYRKKQTENTIKWNKANPAWRKVIQKRAYEKYKKTDKAKETWKRYYKKNREKLLAYMRKRHKERYWKDVEKTRALNRELYRIKKGR